MRRRAFLAGASVTAATAAGVLGAGSASAGSAADARFGVRDDDKDFDPTYGVRRGTNPDIYSDWGIQRLDRVLVYSRTAGPRHAHLGRNIDPDTTGNASLALRGPNGNTPYVITHDHTNPALWPLPLLSTSGGPGQGANVSQLGLVRMLGAEGIEVHITEDVRAIQQLSNNYKAVIFNSPTRDTLWDHARGRTTGGTRLEQGREQLRKYIQGGGGFVGIHNAFGTEYDWRWYEGLLGNANYYNHGENQDGEVVIVNDRDESTKTLPRRWAFRDEWYNLVPFPTNVNVLATVDEKTLAEGTGSTHPGHGDFHPVSWCQYYDGGRSWVTTLGHDSAQYQENSTFPGAAEFQKHIVQGIKSAMGLIPFCTPARGGGRR
jgi:type 1 glutamine amidotransferase